MKLTNAVSGVARSNATRSGYPVLQGAKLKLYALSAVARAGATRSNYHGGKPFIAINGVQMGMGTPMDDVGILGESLTIQTAVNATPATLSMTARGFVPVEGADIIITLGSRNNLRREFGGSIISVSHRYVGDKPVAANMLYDISGIDYSWGLNRRKVSGAYTNASVAAIAASVMTFAPSGYTLHVDGDIGAEILDAITFTENSLPNVLAQLVKRVGGAYRCDYNKVVNLFFENSQTIPPPSTVNALHRSMNGFTFSRDLSQVVTRCLGEFGGSDALEQIAPGATLIPVSTAAWYLAGGGVVLINQQRVNYSGYVLGGGGGLVGPGAAPSAAINATVVPGSGVTPGAHDYAVTYVTANGESLPGPRVSIVSGVIAPPTAAPALDTSKPLAAGSGPAPGTHDYAITGVASSGETTPGPRVTLSTGLIDPPAMGPTPDSVALGPGPDPGGHDYAVLFVTANGATSAGPIGPQIFTDQVTVSPPSSAPSVGSPASGYGPDNGAHVYAVTFATAAGETTPGPNSATITTRNDQVQPPTSPLVVAWTPGGDQIWSGTYYWWVTFLTASGQTTVGPSTSNALSGNYQVHLTQIPIGPPGTTGRRLFLNSNQSPTIASTLINDNVTTAMDILSSADFNSKFVYDQPFPPSNTAGTFPVRVVTLTGIPKGPAGTTSRVLYRTKANQTALLRLATLNDNTTTTYIDTSVPDSGLGGAPPSSGVTQPRQTVHLSNIPKGPAGVIYRYLYRRSGGAGLRFCGSVADNTTTTYTDTTPNASLTSAPPSVNTAYLQQIPLTLPLGGPSIVNRKLYRTKIGDATLYLVATFDNVVTTFTDTVNDGDLGAAAPTTNGAVAQQVNLSAIPLGAAAVTQRRIYRTAANQTPLRYLTVLNDNTTTAMNDVYGDNVLGGTAPTSDTSLLQQPQGNVLVGSTALPLASVASFLASGGWAIVASQLIRYTGISGNNLIGIPPSGVGAIGATITYNVTAVAAPMLIGVPPSGVGAIKYPILKGDPVNLFVQVDDLAAQAAVRAQIPGSDGIIEDELQDRRLSYTEGRARCLARLDMLAARDSAGWVGVVTVRYACRDINSQAGATVTINIGPPINLTGSYLIQRVSASQFQIPNLPPTYQVEASSVRFSAEALLRAAYAAITS